MEGKKSGILNSSSLCHWFPNDSGQVAILCQMSGEIFKVLIVQERHELCRIGWGCMTVPSPLFRPRTPLCLLVSLASAEFASPLATMMGPPVSGFLPGLPILGPQTCTFMTQLPELMIQRLLAPVLALLVLTVHSIPSRPFSLPSRHHLCSALPTADMHF